MYPQIQLIAVSGVEEEVCRAGWHAQYEELAAISADG